jgi:hypothetical protein
MATENAWTIALPASFTTNPTSTLNVRFRIYDANNLPSTISPKGLAVGGEVEDYQWQFTPTAVNLDNLNARPTEQSALLIPLFIVLAAIAGFVTLRILKRRTA